jgi:hypothetical protein
MASSCGGKYQVFRRTFGLSDATLMIGRLNLSIMANRAAVQLGRPEALGARSREMKRTRVSEEIWEQACIALASGSIGLRKLARKPDIPQGTMLARAHREGWSKMIKAANQLTGGEQSLAITPTVLQSVVSNMRDRAERYTEGMVDVSERVLPDLRSMPPNEILNNSRNVEQYDRWSRRNYGLDSMPSSGGSLNLEHSDQSLGRSDYRQIVSSNFA